MNTVLGGSLWDCSLMCLENLIVVSVTFDQLLEHLAVMFDRLCKSFLKIKASKCEPFREKVHFFGHVVSSSDISADPEKIKVVASWPA
jgi:hypothetical protein